MSGPPVVCDGHDVAMVRDEMFSGWHCPRGNGLFGDEDYHRVVSALASRPGSPVATDIRVTGCGEGP